MHSTDQQKSHGMGSPYLLGGDEPADYGGQDDYDESYFAVQDLMRIRASHSAAYRVPGTGGMAGNKSSYVAPYDSAKRPLGAPLGLFRFFG
jgi:hypothetical protein